MDNKEALEYLQKKFIKVSTNCHIAKDYAKNGPMWYRRDDLWQWSKEAYERGEKCFYTEPVDPKNPYGKLRLCEPHYVYKFKDTLTVEEYNKIFNQN